MTSNNNPIVIVSVTSNAQSPTYSVQQDQHSLSVCKSCLFQGLRMVCFPFCPRESLEGTRLKFSLHRGKVTALCPQEGQQVWAVNIKRALLSMLQTSHTAAKEETVKEVTKLQLMY